MTLRCSDQYGLERIANSDTNGAFISHIIGEISGGTFCHYPALIEIFGRVADGQSQIDAE